MSELVVFIIGTVVFAITVYGTVMAGGIALTQREMREDPVLRKRLDDGDIPKRDILKMKY